VLLLRRRLQRLKTKKEKKKERERTSDPTKKSGPGEARRGIASDILDGEERHKASLEAEPKSTGQRVKDGHGL
jgi:hypothetical protein